MTPGAGRKALVLAAVVLAVLGVRALGALADVAREVAAIRPAGIRNALSTPLEERLRREMALPSGSLGTLPTGTIGWELYGLLRRETEPDAGIFLLLKGGHPAFRLYLRFSAWLDPRVVVWVNDSDEGWVPTYDHPGTREYVLDLASSGAAAWKRRAEPVAVAADYELWRVEE